MPQAFLRQNVAPDTIRNLTLAAIKGLVRLAMVCISISLSCSLSCTPICTLKFSLIVFYIIGSILVFLWTAAYSSWFAVYARDFMLLLVDIYRLQQQLQEQLQEQEELLQQMNNILAMEDQWHQQQQDQNVVPAQGG